MGLATARTARFGVGNSLRSQPPVANGSRTSANFGCPEASRRSKSHGVRALGVLFEVFGPDAAPVQGHPALAAFDPVQLRLVERMLARGINSPWTSSAGRLFDAVASLAGLRHLVRHEGQAAMELEFAADRAETSEHYPAPVRMEPVPAVLDWEPAIRGILLDVAQGVSIPMIAARFHNTLVKWIVAVAKIAAQERVLLSGGCFQNVYLAERTIASLREAGFRPYWHQRVPPNDGGIALGQVVAPPCRGLEPGRI